MEMNDSKRLLWSVRKSLETLISMAGVSAANTVSPASRHAATTVTAARSRYIFFCNIISHLSRRRQKGGLRAVAQLLKKNQLVLIF